MVLQIIATFVYALIGSAGYLMFGINVSEEVRLCIAEYLSFVADNLLRSAEISSTRQDTIRS